MCARRQCLAKLTTEAADAKTDDESWTPLTRRGTAAAALKERAKGRKRRGPPWPQWELACEKKHWEVAAFDVPWRSWATPWSTTTP